LAAALVEVTLGWLRCELASLTPFEEARPIEALKGA